MILNGANYANAFIEMLFQSENTTCAIPPTLETIICRILAHSIWVYLLSLWKEYLIELFSMDFVISVGHCYDGSFTECHCLANEDFHWMQTSLYDPHCWADHCYQCAKLKSMAKVAKPTYWLRQCPHKLYRCHHHHNHNNNIRIEENKMPIDCSIARAVFVIFLRTIHLFMNQLKHKQLMWKEAILFEYNRPIQRRKIPKYFRSFFFLFKTKAKIEAAQIITWLRAMCECLNAFEIFVWTAHFWYCFRSSSGFLPLLSVYVRLRTQ